MSKLAAAIIPAAGSGTRMKLDHPKQFHMLAGMPILIHTVKAFLNASVISQVVIVAPQDMIDETEQLFDKYHIDCSKIQIIAGGVRRQDSVFLGLQELYPDIDIVLVHDGARPMINQRLITDCYEAACKDGAAIAAIPVKDTLKKGSSSNLVEATIDREGLWQAQTPQAASVNLLKQAYAANDDNDATDESSMLERAGIPVTLVEGSETNIKITRPEDLHIAENLLGKSMTPQIRIGHGFDAHQFAKDRKLVLGGVTIPHEYGLAGHSDADVLTHALCDAILGALAAGDIGKHFPDSSAEFKDIYSIKLLEKVMEHAELQSYSISNIDITVVCQAPKLAPYLDDMQQILATACKVSLNSINIKATTTEKMGYTGRKEGISSHAVVLLHAFSS